MLIINSILEVLDNSAPTLVKCIHIYNKKHIGYINDLILIVIKKSIQNIKINQKNKNNLTKGILAKAVIVQTKKKFLRKDGTSIRFDSNFCIILNKQMNLAGTRITGPIGKEVKQNVLCQKFLTLAPLII